MSSGSTSAIVVDPELVGDPFGGRAVVAGEHGDPDARLVEGRDGGGGDLADRVGDADHRDGSAVDGDEHCRAAAGGNLVAPRPEVADRDALRFHKASVADGDLVVIDLGEGADAGDVAEAGGAQPRNIGRVDVPHDGLGERMFGLAFECAGEGRHPGRDRSRRALPR